MNRLLFVSSLIAVAVLLRLLPHPPNFTPVCAIALFGGFALGKKESVYIPLLIMGISDLIIGTHIMMPAVYLCFMVTVYLGWQLQKKATFGNLILASTVSSVVFFLFTNFVCWLMFYERSFDGLVSCYVLAIPFFKNTFVSSLIFSTVLFRVLVFAELRYPSLAVD